MSEVRLLSVGRRVRRLVIMQEKPLFGRGKTFRVCERAIVIESTAMRLFVGIDGGGSKTECVVANEKDVLGRFTAGTCKISRAGKDAATASLQAAVQGAFYAAKVTPEEVQHTCFGVAGSSQPGVAEWAKQTLGKMM